MNKMEKINTKNTRLVKEYEELVRLFEKTNKQSNFFKDLNIGNVTINENRIVNINKVKGLKLTSRVVNNKIKLMVEIYDNITKPIHFCFGVLSKKYEQILDVIIRVRGGKSAKIIAHCFFPRSEGQVKHYMTGRFIIENNASLEYIEEHYHHIGADVKLNLNIDIWDKAQYITEFRLSSGHVGSIDIGLNASLKDYSKMDTLIVISGDKNDRIVTNERASLIGKFSKALIVTKMILKDRSSSYVYNEIIGKGDYSEGHIECKEILFNNAKAKAIPIANVLNKNARITHEAAIGSVNKDVIENLLSKGIEKKKAEQIIIKGLINS